MTIDPNADDIIDFVHQPIPCIVGATANYQCLIDNENDTTTTTTTTAGTIKNAFSRKRGFTKKRKKLIKRGLKLVEKTSITDEE